MRNGKNYTFDAFFILCIAAGSIIVLNLVLAIQFFFFDMMLEADSVESAKQDILLNKDEDMSQPMLSRIWKAVRAHEDQMMDQSPCMEKLKLWCKTVAQDIKFEAFISIVIFLNSLTLGSEHYEQPDWVSEMQK